MKNKTPIYQEIYEDLKNKILYGVFQKGDRFPSYQTLCAYYRVSLAPVRVATRMLAENGYIQTAQRSSSIVRYTPGGDGGYHKWTRQDVLLLEDSYATLHEITLPILEYCAQFCGEKECDALERTLDHMNRDLDDVMKYWLANEQFWHILLSRGKNQFIGYCLDSLRCVMESLFLVARNIKRKDIDMRKKLIAALRAGVSLEGMDLNAVFREHLLQSGVELEPGGDSVCYFKERSCIVFHQTRPMYTLIVMNLLQQVEAGKYKKGDFFPCAEELCRQYQVSAITIAHVAQVLKTLGFVKSRRGKGGGMQLLIGPEDVNRFSFHMKEKENGIRRLADCLEFTALTCVNTARHAASQAAFTEIYELRQEIARWNDECAVYTPALSLLFAFIVSHIRLEGLQTIYRALWDEYISGDLLCFPLDNSAEKRTSLHRLCFNAVQALIMGDVDLFAQRSQSAFAFLHQWMLDKCYAHGIPV